jgi:16S rRNA (uracil1498-N3)-methyltransferase
MSSSIHALHRFFVSPEDIHGETIALKSKDIKHIRSVLRLGKGDRIVVSDSLGWDFLVELSDVASRRVVGQILKKKFVSKALPQVAIFQALPKGPKMDLIIQKATELGVSEIEPVVMERSVTKVDRSKAEKRIQRWRLIGEEAAKQCGRSYLPVISDILTWQEALKKLAGYDLVIVPWEGEQKVSLKDILSGSTAKKIAVMIGPEGGFSRGEINNLLSLGAKVVTLGPQILRAETAAIATLSVVLYHFGRLGR